jgi:hypothetical protein
MSLKVVRPFFRSVLNSQGYVEWVDGFNTQNIPSTILEKGAYFIETVDCQGVKLNQLDQELDLTCVVYLFFKGHRKPADALDFAIGKSEDLMKEILKPSNRVGQHEEGIKNVVFENFLIEPKDATNDNIVQVQLNFNLRIVIATN